MSYRLVYTQRAVRDIDRLDAGVKKRIGATETVRKKIGMLPVSSWIMGTPGHGLFFAHLALEKILKAIVCKQSQDLAPRLHNLSRLAELAALTLDTGKMEIIAEMNAFHIEGRYPESLTKPPTREEALNYMAGAEGVFQWLMNQS